MLKRKKCIIPSAFINVSTYAYIVNNIYTLYKNGCDNDLNY